MDVRCETLYFETSVVQVSEHHSHPANTHTRKARVFCVPATDVASPDVRGIVPIIWCTRTTWVISTKDLAYLP